MQRLANLEAIKRFEFHDAVIGDLRYSVLDRDFTVGLSVYESEDAASRIPAVLKVPSLVRAIVRLDFPNLDANASAGNVMNCRVDLEESAARLYLCGGLLEVASAALSMEPNELPPTSLGGAGGEVLAASFSELESWDLAFAVLSHVEVSTKAASCTLALQFYNGDGSDERINALLRLSRCSSCMLTLDGKRLSVPEVKYGNVQNGHVYAKRGIVWLYLEDGLIEVRARAAELVAQ